MLAEFGGESREESDGKARGLMDELKSKGRTASMSGQTFLLGVFLRKKAPHFDLPRLKRKAVAHGHCHHKALMKMNDDEAVFEKMGLDYEVLDSGCCRMAGAFSCREQIEQMTDRRALHLAQVIQMAMREGERSATRDYPEIEYAQPRPRRPSKRAVVLGVIPCGLVVAGGIWGLNRKGPRKRPGKLWA